MKFRLMICRFLLIVGMILCTSHHSRTYCQTNLLSRNNFPYISQVIEGFNEANFEYPTSVDDILAYWKVYKRSKENRKLFSRRTIRMLDKVTFDRLDMERKHINFIHTDSSYVVCYDRDTLFWMTTKNLCDPLEGYSTLDRLLFRNFSYVSMQRKASGKYNIANEKMQNCFNRGLYAIVKAHVPTFWEDRRQRKPFRVAILSFEGNRLQAKCSDASFDPSHLPFYEEIQGYVAKFAAEKDLSRIIFYYVYE